MLLLNRVKFTLNNRNKIRHFLNVYLLFVIHFHRIVIWIDCNHRQVGIIRQELRREMCASG